MSTIGHPLSDLVNLLTPFFNASGGPNPHKGFLPNATPGIPSKEQAVAWYAETAGWDPAPDMTWGNAFGMFRGGVICQGIAARYARRQASSARAKDYVDMVVPMGEGAWRMVRAAMEQGGKARL
jgi:aminoglycoside phosphotransferase (APT) family kinase protein